VRLLIVTAGAGGMYCGSCLRDNALATELIARKHDVTLLPVYTPTLTDEPNVSGGRVFFGGVSVYLQQHLSLFRHTPDFLDRLWDSPALIRAVSGRGVSTDPKLLGELTVSMLKGEQGFQAKELRKMLEWLRTLPPYDAVNLPNALLLGMAPSLRRERLGPLVCTLQGEDLFLEALQEPYRSQSMALIRRLASEVDAFVAVSASYADFMTGYLGLPRERVRTVPLGPDDEFNCPESHLDFIRKRLVATDGLHILSIGYSGLDSGLLQLLGSSGNSIRSLFAVNHEGVSALEAATRIATAFSDVAHPDMAYAGTFESFTQSGGLEEYLTTLA